MLNRFHKLFSYTRWADNESLQSMKAAVNTPAKAMRIISHVFAAENLWLCRLKGEVVRMPIWPDWKISECASHMVTIHGEWQGYLAGIGESDLQTVVAYTNTQGEAFSDTVEDIIEHVVVHGAYHRGQVASELRNAGYTPVLTDYIHAVRSGKI